MIDTYKELLGKLVAFQSISTDPQFKGEIEKTVQFLVELFGENGFEVTRSDDYGNPIILASYETDPEAETCLIYGHYDVQPAGDPEEWSGDPFQITEKDGRLIARGAVDNKGQFLIHMVAIFALIKDGKLNYNIKFLLEGEEETGGKGIIDFINENRELVKADFALVSDGEIVSGRPTVDISFRGLLNWELQIKSSQTELHSGLYGNIVPNAAVELSRIIAQFYDENGEVALEFLPRNHEYITEEVIENNRSIAPSQEEFFQITGVKKIVNETEVDFMSKAGLLCTIDVLGMWSGYTAEGYKTAIPNVATAKLSIRVSPLWEVEEIQKAMMDYLKNTIPDYLDWEVRNISASDGVIMDSNSEYVTRATKVLENVWDAKVAMHYVGGAIPVITSIVRDLDTPVVSVSMGNEDCNMHGVDENFKVDLIDKGLEFSRRYFGN